MKLQLDTINKTIKIEGNVKLSELTETLDKILPGLWKEFTLESNTTIINWQNPIYIQPAIPYRPYWYQEKYWTTCKDDNVVLCSNTDNVDALNKGQFNIEC